jgi:peptidoglycan/LPS O-acetylase OafA/YrhL
VSERSLRPTWAWLWTFLAAVLLALATVIIVVIALSGNDRGDVVLAVLLIGFPAILGVFALGTLALIMARPSGARWKAVRRWGLALLGGSAFLIGMASVADDVQGAVPLIVAGACALAFLVLDLRRGRNGG